MRTPVAVVMMGLLLALGWLAVVGSAGASPRDQHMFFAQDIPTPTTILGAFILVSISMSGVIVWLMRHVFSTTIPALLANQEQERKSHEATINAVVKGYKEEAAAERKLCEEKFELVNASLVALATSSVADGRTQVAEINRHTSEAMAQYRHDMKDSIQQAVLENDLYLLRKREKQEAKPEDQS